MSESPRLELVRLAYERFNNQDIPGVLELLDPDVELPDIIRDVVLTGRDSVRRSWERQFGAAEHSARAAEFLEMGDTVIAVVFHEVHDHDGHPIGSGVAAVHRLTIRGDRIAKLEFTAVDEIPAEVRQLLA